MGPSGRWSSSDRCKAGGAGNPIPGNASGSSTKTGCWICEQHVRWEGATGTKSLPEQHSEAALFSTSFRRMKKGDCINTFEEGKVAMYTQQSKAAAAEDRR